MNKIKSKKRQKTKDWWRSSRNWDRIALSLLGVFAVAAITVFIWLAVQGGQVDEPPVARGQPIEPFTLPDVVSGKSVSLADYLGKQDVVLVGYMGFF